MTTYLIVCHDAGGAENVSSWILHHPENHYSFLLEGPALKVFQRKNLGADVIGREAAFALRPSVVLTGSSWASNLEKEALKNFAGTGARRIVFLDHWTNYRPRLHLNDEFLRPEAIWVADKYALSLARSEFPKLSVDQVPNYFFEDLAKEVRSLHIDDDGSGTTRVLYVTEPTSVAALRQHGHARALGYTEDEALKEFLSYLKALPGRFSVRIRRHPSEEPKKYASFVADDVQLRVMLAEETSLALALAWAEWVVGCDSMAMALAAHLGKKALCAIPKGGKMLTLPYAEITRLFQ